MSSFSPLPRKTLNRRTHTSRANSPTRAYILLDISEGKSVEAAKALQSMRGVVIADPLEEPPDIIVVVEDSDRLKLADVGP